MSFNLNRWGRQTETMNAGRIVLQSGVPDNAPAYFTYASADDTLAQISADNYFSAVVYDLAVDDVIYAGGSDDSGIVIVDTLDRAAGTVTVTTGGGLGVVTVPNGGTGLTSLVPYAVLTGGTTSTSNMQQIAPLTNGQLIIGNTGTASVAANLTAGRNIGITNAAGSITISANNGYTTTATAAGTTVLTSSSTYLQYFTGTTTQVVTLPAVSTLALGTQFRIVNNSTGVVTVQTSGALTVLAMNTLTEIVVTSVLTGGVGANTWSWEYMAWQNANGNTISTDVTIHGVTVGWGPANGSNLTTVIGRAAAQNATNITDSVFIGNQCASSLNSGANPFQAVYIGSKCMTAATAPTDSNVCIGYNAVSSASFTGGSNVTVGKSGLAACTTGNHNTAIGNAAGSTLTTGNTNTFLGNHCADGTLSGSTGLTTGGSNTFLGSTTGGTTNATAGAIAIGFSALADAASGGGSGDSGPGISIGSAATTVGFRGNGTIYTGGTGRGFWNPKINGTNYFMPLFITGTSTANAMMTTDSNGSPILSTAIPSGITQTAISTAPVASGSASLSLGSAYQNSAAYDVVVVVYLGVTSATAGNIKLGVGSTNTPTQQTIVASLTVAAQIVIPVTIYIPASYYALLSVDGGITTSSIMGQQTMAV